MNESAHVTYPKQEIFFLRFTQFFVSVIVKFLHRAHCLFLTTAEAACMCVSEFS